MARSVNKPSYVIGISGSPRKGANTDAVVQEVLKGANDAGARTRFIRVADLDIAPCGACYACAENAVCVKNDDMQALYRELKKADAWVIGTPVYWFTMSAQLKTPLDRLFAFAHDPDANPFKGKRAAVVTLSGDPDAREMGKTIFESFKMAFDYLKVKFAGRLALQGVDATDVKSRWSGYAPARRLGAKLVK
jgi:multimeric flavodoxin WrbA